MPAQLSSREIDSIAIEFEKQWQPGQSLEVLRRSVERRVVPGSESFNLLLQELVLVDLEKRWSNRSARLGLQVDGQSVESTPDFSQPPSFLDYERLFEPGRGDTQLRVRLAQTELNARWAFGDIPELEDYAELAPLLRRPEVEIPRIKLVSCGQIQAQLDLIGQVLIGRQAPGEPTPPAVIAGRPRKLICADLSEMTTSRNQLLVGALAKGLFRFVNGSRNRFLSLGGQINLAPGESRVIKVLRAIEIRLKEAVVILEMA